MSGSWQINHLKEAQRDLKRIIKVFKSKTQKEDYYNFYESLLKPLAESGIHPLAIREPIPGGVSLPDGVELLKLRINVPGLTGAFSKLRVLFLRFLERKEIRIVAIYTHKDYEKRPPEDFIANLIKKSMH